MMLENIAIIILLCDRKICVRFASYNRLGGKRLVELVGGCERFIEAMETLAG